jgi:hypothetical protein
MDDKRFEALVLSHVSLFEAPDYTAKGDAVVFIRNNARRARPILQRLAAEGSAAAKALLDAPEPSSQNKPRHG